MLLCAALLTTVVRAAGHTGVVTATGVPLPGATVTATQGEQTFVTSTDAQGAYVFPDLADGAWTIRVEMPGFAPLTREVGVGPDPAPAAFELTLLPFAEIARTLPLVQAAPAGPPSPASARTPGAGRSESGNSAREQAQGSATGAFQRAAVAAQAVPAGGLPAGGVAPSEEPPVDPVFGAADGFLINGSVNNAAASPFAQSAAFGNNRRLFGPRYSFMLGVNARHSAWDASPATFGARLPSNPDYQNLNVSGTIGGPLRIPGLISNGPFFTVSYQRATDQNATTGSASMPDARERAGDFSQSVDAFGRPAQVIDPRTGLPFPGNVIPADRISPQAAALLAYYPLPNLAGGGINYQRALPTTTTRDSVSANINPYSFTPRDQLSGTFQFARNRTGTTSLFGFEDDTRTTGFDVSAAYTHRFSPTFLVRLRHTFGRQSATTDPYFAGLTNVSGDAGIAGNNQDPENWGPPSIGLSSVSGLSAGLYSSSRTHTNTTATEAFLARGRHSVTFGGEVRRQQLDLLSQQNPRGSFFFDGSATGSDLADFLLGIPRTSQIAFGNADKDFTGRSYAAYITDDFRVGPSLTLNLGVRWEYEAPHTEAHGRLVNLDIAPGFTAVAPVLASDPVGPLTGRTFGSSLVRPDRSGIQPRLAMAWRPILGSSVVVRAGYGIYRNNGLYSSLARALAQQPPLSYVVNAQNSRDTPLTLANGFIQSGAITANTYAIDPDFRVSHAQIWQASVQRDLPWSLTVLGTYIGTKGSNLLQQFLPNTYAPGSVNPCPSCPIGFAYVTSGGSSLRNSGAIQVRRRLRAGLTATGQYTLAKGTDNASSFSGTSGRSAQDWRDLDAEHAPSDDDQRHQFAGQVQYTTGVGAAGGGFLTGVTGALVRGWTLTGQVIVGSGRPLTPLYNVALPGTALNGTVRASLTSDPFENVPAGYYVNPLAYAIPGAGEWGDAPRNSIRGPRQFTVNAGVTRSFPLNGRVNLEWRVDATNLLNQVTYSTVNTIVNSPLFGLPTTANDMRRINTTVRVRF